MEQLGGHRCAHSMRAYDGPLIHLTLATPEDYRLTGVGGLDEEGFYLKEEASAQGTYPAECK